MANPGLRIIPRTPYFTSERSSLVMPSPLRGFRFRYSLDVAREAPASRLLLVNREGEQEIDCLDRSGFPFFGQLILDCLNRTEIAMTQRHAFKAAELSMRAQSFAESLL